MNLRKHVSLDINIRGIGQTPTLEINDRVKNLQEKGKKIYNFGIGQSPFPVPIPVVDALKLYAHENKYLPAKGLPVLREAVADFHKAKDNLDINPDYVLVGPGSKQLMFLLQLAFYGEIVVPTPCWVSYVPQAKILGKKVNLIHTSFEDRWHITPQHLEEFLEKEQDVYRPRILVLNYPGNPDGLTYTPDQIKKIAEVARKYELILLSDEIYGQIHHKGEHISISRFYPEGTIISSGLSKWCSAGGWRLGTFAFPKDLDWLLDAMVSIASETYTSVCSPIQYAAIHAFRGGVEIERYLLHSRRILSALGRECYKVLSNTGLRIYPPEGGFYIFLDFTPLEDHLSKRGIKDSTTLCERILQETGVALLPGVAFERPFWELTARLSYINFNGAKALTTSETIPLQNGLPENFISQICEETIEGTKRIAEWIMK
jgi:aspartate aminotransferase